MRSSVAVLLVAACSTAPPPPAARPKPPPSDDLVSALAPLTPADAFKDFDWSPEQARAPSEMIFVNVQVLSQMTSLRFMTAMMSMKASLGVECATCHVEKNFPADDKDQKRMARRMLLLARHLNDATFGGETRVTCWTCHRAELKPPSAPEGFAEKLAAAPPQPALEVPADLAGKPARKMWKDLQVLGSKPAPAMRATMAAFTVTLGVECGYCHDPKDFASEAKPAKARTRDMVRLVNRVNAELGTRGAVTCWTCHRGVARPPAVPPPAAHQ